MTPIESDMVRGPQLDGHHGEDDEQEGLVRLEEVGPGIGVGPIHGGASPSFTAGLLRRAEQFDPERSFWGWLYRIARNKYIDALRRQKPSPRGMRLRGHIQWAARPYSELSSYQSALYWFALGQMQ